MILRRFLLILCLAGWTRAQPITVSAAISLKDALQEVAHLYELQNGDEVKLNFGSSGQLMTQIRRGAPVDLFISAAAIQVEELARDGIVDLPSRTVVATNRLVLVVRKDRKQAPRSFQELSDEKIERISIGQPDIVPAGHYAQQVLSHLGIADAVRRRLIFGTNVRQVLSYVERGEVDAGIVYATDALVAGEQVRVVAVADPSWHAPIEYPAAIVAASRNRAAAERFLHFLQTRPAQQVLSNYGFGAAAPATTQPAR
jgi:molybdate transport system substrate-binding protein